MKDDIKKELLQDTSYDSRELLNEAVERAKGWEGSLGTGGSESETAKAIASLNKDRVEMGKPDVFPITSNTFYKRKFAIPVDLGPTFANYQFLYVEIPIGMKTKSNWSFNRYRLFVEFENKDDLKVIDIFPSPKFQKKFEVNGNLNIGIDTSLKFKADTPSINLKGVAGDLSASAGAGITESGQLNLIKTFEYVAKKCIINTEGEGLNWIDWQFNSIDEEFKSDSRKLIAIIRVPKTINELIMNGTLVAYRNPDSIMAGLSGLFNNFSDVLQSWFKKGVPQSFPEKPPLNLNLLEHIQDEI